ncbi:MAG: response regulator [Polyangiaceae bacterium]|nr:response regulator [Polyangiaceae bacterium]
MAHAGELPCAAPQPPRVLVIDDNVALAENVCELLGALEDPRVVCDVVGSGGAALSLAEQYAIDVAFVDLHLPDTAGTDLSDELRRRCPFIEIVIITGDTTVQSAIRAVKTGAFAYVLKPFRGDELLETARRALAQAELCREREHLRAELERSEKRHREVVDAVPAFVLALGPDGDIVLWNRHLERVTGYAREEMLGQTGSHLVGDSGAERRLPLRDGGHRLIRWQRAVVSGGATNVSYAVGVDVTEEQAMLRRTLRAERLAAVGTLAAGLAHEVRNPLNSALLQLAVLDRRIYKGHGAEQLLSVSRLVKDEIVRLDRLVSDFLEFARPRPLKLATTSVNELVRGVLELVAVAADEQHVDLKADLGLRVGNISVEPERMRQVLLNLLQNSLDVMPQGGALTVRTHGPDPSGYVHVEVRDTGPGFSEDAPVFDAFYTTKEKGTGLGLAIAHRIVTEHGGQIHVRSTPGDTCFTIALPEQP